MTLRKDNHLACRGYNYCSGLVRCRHLIILITATLSQRRLSISKSLFISSHLFNNSASAVATMADTQPSTDVTPKSPVDEAGLSVDEIQLRAQGHIGELPRQFSAFATLSLAFSLTNSWVGYSAVFPTPLFAGGGPTVVFGLITAMIACSFITAGLAELASAFPSSGGQYQYVWIVGYTKAPTNTSLASHSWSLRQRIELPLLLPLAG